MKKKIKAHEERNVKSAKPNEPSSTPLPQYLLDRSQATNAKALSSAIKNKRAEKAAKFSVPLPPTFLLPMRCRYFNSTTQIVDGDSSLDTLRPPISSTIPPQATSQTSDALHSSGSGLSSSHSAPAITSPEPATPTPTPHESLRTLLPLLKAQRSHYITVHIQARPYLLTVGDILRLPFHMTGVVPGDILRLTRATIIGSRDYTLKGAPYVDENLFECRARVVGVESEPMKIELRTKPRQRRVKRIKSKHRYTVLRLAELKIKSLEELGR